MFDRGDHFVSNKTSKFPDNIKVGEKAASTCKMKRVVI